MPDPLPLARRFVLAIDIGTGGPKVGLVSLDGVVAWSRFVPVATDHLPDGGVIQDAEAWWRLIIEAARGGVGSGAVPPDQIVAVSCTGQWASTVPVDAAGHPVGPCVMWMDTRGGPHSRRAIGGPVAGYSPVSITRWIRRTGGAPSTAGADPIGHILHLEHDQPAVAAAARWYLEPVDYLSMRFTGVAAASHASMAGAWLTDNRRLDLLDYDPVLVRAAGVPADKLPPLVATGAVIGEVLPEVAAALGLPVGVRVVTGTPDLHSAAVGAGTVTDYQTHLAISTTSWISCPVPAKKTDAIRQIGTVPGVTPDHYLVANNHETGGACLQWLADNVLSPADGLGGRTPSYDELTTLAATAPAGSGDVLFTPWLAGERSPVDDHSARGGFHNLSLGTTQAHLVRAVLEGVAYNSRWLFEAVEEFAGRRLEPIRIIGGGANSDLWCQIHADVLDRTVEQVADPIFANLRGAALFAGMALGAIEAEQVHSLVKVKATYRPDVRNRAVYDRLYAEFPGLFKSQKPMFHRLNRA
ncbi:MAG TPA: FGGY-family carbohydrate kinase [Acidimicrobiales bacterium]|nr:FGGY-family carbohydrate kinase [Acidimicrobiales bacterium]